MGAVWQWLSRGQTGQHVRAAVALLLKQSKYKVREGVSSASLFIAGIDEAHLDSVSEREATSAWLSSPSVTLVFSWAVKQRCRPALSNPAWRKQFEEKLKQFSAGNEVCLLNTDTCLLVYAGAHVGAGQLQIDDYTNQIFVCLKLVQTRLEGDLDKTPLFSGWSEFRFWLRERWHAVVPSTLKTHQFRTAISSWF